MPAAFQPTLKAGDPAPKFSGITTDGSTIQLKDLAGKFVVLYFYPKDNTPGCNREACAFRDAHPGFTQRNAVVIGVSVDPVSAHKKFTEKFQLPFPLIADVEKTIVTAYGVWGEKSFLGRNYQGIHRVTFLIGPDGVIRHLWPKVKPEIHAQEVLEVLATLSK
jgi:peroxiredoxin Q/BCP